MNAFEEIVEAIDNGKVEDSLYVNGSSVDWAVDDEGFYAETLNNYFETDQIVNVWEDDSVDLRMIMPIDGCTYNVASTEGGYYFQVDEDLTREDNTPQYDRLTLTQDAVDNLLDESYFIHSKNELHKIVEGYTTGLIR